MNRATIRTEIIEPWLAEVNSDFYTTSVMNFAINHEYRQFCKDTAAGPLARYDYSTVNGDTVDGVNRTFSLPVELVRIWRIDYDTSYIEVPFMAFEQFSVRFGSTWPNILSASLPLAYSLQGDYSLTFHPIPANGSTWRLYGPIIPDAPTGDSATLLVSDSDCYTIAARAYVSMIERNASRLGTPPPNYQRAMAMADKGTLEARERIRRLTGAIRSVGRFAPFTSDLSHRYWEPSFRWP